MNAPCPEYRDRIADAVTTPPSQEAQAELDRHVAGCASCREFREGLLGDDRRMAELVGALDGRLADLEGRIVGMIQTQALESEAVPRTAVPAGRRVAATPRWLRYAAAAALAIGALLVARAWLAPALVPVAWADVLARVVASDGFICRWRAVIHAPQEIRIEGEHSERRDIGARDDIYYGGRLLAQNYLVPSTREQYGVYHEARSYFRMRLAPEEFDHVAVDRNARQMMQLFQSYPFEELGTRRIDGVNAPGIEIRDPDFVLGAFDRARLRLWVDPETNWPVRLEADYETERAGMRERIVMTDFEWDPALSAAELEPEIPDDYELLFDLDVPRADEETAVEALRTYADLTSGRYPATLTWGAAATGPAGGFSNLSEASAQGEGVLERFVGIRSAIMFYVSLQKSGSDVAYHGDRVAATDSDAVLMRWSVGRGRYRVVYGDLSRETVDARRLAQLEGRR